jgi:hypothetical protein
VTTRHGQLPGIRLLAALAPQRSGCGLGDLNGITVVVDEHACAQRLSQARQDTMHDSHGCEPATRTGALANGNGGHRGLRLYDLSSGKGLYGRRPAEPGEDDCAAVFRKLSWGLQQRDLRWRRRPFPSGPLVWLPALDRRIQQPNRIDDAGSLELETGQSRRASIGHELALVRTRSRDRERSQRRQPTLLARGLPQCSANAFGNVDRPLDPALIKRALGSLAREATRDEDVRPGEDQRPRLALNRERRPATNCPPSLLQVRVEVISHVLDDCAPSAPRRFSRFRISAVGISVDCLHPSFADQPATSLQGRQLPSPHQQARFRSAVRSACRATSTTGSPQGGNQR